MTKWIRNSLSWPVLSLNLLVPQIYLIAYLSEYIKVRDVFTFANWSFQEQKHVSKFYKRTYAVEL